MILKLVLVAAAAALHGIPSGTLRRLKWDTVRNLRAAARRRSGDMAASVVIVVLVGMKPF